MEDVVLGVDPNNYSLHAKLSFPLHPSQTGYNPLIEAAEKPYQLICEPECDYEAIERK